MDTKLVSIRYLCKNIFYSHLKIMEIVSARDFRAKQTSILSKVKAGESVLLTSRIGTFKIVPVTENDMLTSRICEGLREVQKIESGKQAPKSARSFLNEL